MNDLKKFSLVIILLGFLCGWINPVWAVDDNPPVATPSANPGQDNAPKISDFINRIRIITKENDRLKNLVETYESNLLTLEEEHKKTTETIKQLQSQLTQSPGNCSESIYSKEDVDQLIKELADTHYNLGVIYQDQSKYDEAQKEYQKVLVVKPDDADANYNLAVIYDTVKDDKTQALFHYKKYLESNPQALDRAEVEGLIDRLLVP